VISVLELHVLSKTDSDVIYFLNFESSGINYKFEVATDHSGSIVPSEVQIDGQGYRIEQSGNDVVLLKTIGGQRVVANLDSGKAARVNPTKFTLE
jgi:hypothetical protein